ncbi:MAG: PKD domain-containing protein [Gemmatimonadales bacterium]
MLLPRICSTLHSARFPRTWRNLVALVLAAGCAGSDLMLPSSGGSKTVMRVVAGDSLTGQVGELLGDPVVVEVIGADSQPIAGAAVEFEFTSAGQGGEIHPPSTTTNEAGQAEAHLLLGDKIGAQNGEARVVVDGAIASRVGFVAVATAVDPDNRPPEADFTWHCDNLVCQLTDASSDPDGRVSAWSWQFGDGNGSDQADPLHAYAAPGTYRVTLAVTDNGGATAQASTEVEVSAAPPPPSNKPPQADFDVRCHDRFCSFSDKSKDDDGNVVSWHWDFGDGQSSDQRSPFHFYGDEGHYDVTLTVADNDGGSDSKTHEVDAGH